MEVKHRPKSGKWHTEHGRTVWREKLDWNSYKEYEPIQVEGISREAKFKIIFLKEFKDEDSLSGKKMKFFAQDCTIKIRSDVAPHIVLRYNDADMRYYLSDLHPLGNTFLAPFEESTDTLIVEKSIPYLIQDIEEAKRLMQNTGYKFGKVSTDNFGNVSEYITTV